MEFVYETVILVLENVDRNSVFSYLLLHSSNSLIALFLFSLILLIQNIRKTSNDKSLKNQEKPGQSRKNQHLNPEDIFMRRKV